ncbi:uracil-DNA glycosylase [Arthrobacter gengyunqii]|uniref:Uracil-DNA glycosylase n=1 Tax=Arthrobacter gengyunqii TaxID=2886940 RepID=A0A9X1LYA3_9MICC|nr:uracil-DNA glycosylase [Arthrobacter gengyunqii]MCC3267143.1 uracil-DNA glycosylase [Arthrobacter gengyunqii]MCC3267923.1 uracil-DNA glycosylase [Arthrobacter gengyunqii]UOY95348.1 uracil-DNA glycosylase [Arthrobacter gengyunqii]
MQSLDNGTQSEELWNRRYDDNVAEVNQLCDSLKALKPGTEVPYIDPMHDVGETRIVSLFSNIGTAHPSGFITAGDDDAVARLLGVHWQVGLRPEYVMPWNTYPWHVPGEPNGKLTKEQIQEGLKPLLRFLALVPRASAIVAHGTEAQRLCAAFLKTENRMIYRRSFKIYKARSVDGRAFGATAERQEEGLATMRIAYKDAMARTGLAIPSS